MKRPGIIEQNLGNILGQYQQSFTGKIYNEENNELDLLMGIFGITPDIKRENRQYWGRELGMCWERLIVELCQHSCKDFKPALRFGNDEPCDLIVGKSAIDAKYRIGSGDSGFSKKFQAYASLLKGEGYEPTLLILREDNLRQIINKCHKSGWTIFVGEETFSFIKDLTGFDFKHYLQTKALEYKVQR